MSDSSTPELNVERLRRLANGDELAAPHAVSLVRNMQSEDEEHRAWTSDALRAITQLPEELADEVAALCVHDNPAVAAAACGQLIKLGAKATNYQAALVATLTSHPSLSARQQAALALASIKPLNADSLQALRTAAASSDPRLQRLATAALGSS